MSIRIKMQGQPRARLSRRESKRKVCGNIKEIGEFSFIDLYKWK
jgi:hypothetical protein